MKAISINTKLYFLLAHADGEVHKKEMEMSEKMMWHEAINKNGFEDDLKVLAERERESIFQECVDELQKFNKNDQINCLAWMCLIANADGFMDKNEWQLIYGLYHKHLNLDLNEIMQRQKELHRFISQYRTPPKVENKNIRPENNGPSKSKMAFPL